MFSGELRKSVVHANRDKKLCFLNSFLIKTTALQQVIFAWNLSIIIIVKLSKLWTFVFESYKKYLNPLRKMCILKLYITAFLETA